MVLGCLSPGLVKLYIHPSSATCTGEIGYCSGRQYHTLLYIFPSITVFAKEDTVAPEETVLQRKILLSKTLLETHLRKRCGLSLTQGQCSLAD